MCIEKAEWVIVHGQGPNDYTESCTEHVGVMLSDAKEHRIYQIPDSDREHLSLCCFMEPTEPEQA